MRPRRFAVGRQGVRLRHNRLVVGYRWLVALHVAAVVGFLVAHGAAAAMGLRLRRETSPDSIRSLVVLSTLSTRVMYPFLVLVLLTGIAAGFAGRWWGFGWIWLAIGVLIATIILMNVLGQQYNPLRGEARERRHRGPIAETPDVIRKVAASTRPGPISGLGVVALLVLVWLMVVKPF
jgi:hypothetical protein